MGLRRPLLSAPRWERKAEIQHLSDDVRGLEVEERASVELNPGLLTIGAEMLKEINMLRFG